MPSTVPLLDRPPLEMDLDAEDRIIACGPGWEAFALANGAPTLAVGTLIGTALLDSITGKVTRVFTQGLLARVRATGRPLVLPYRCDAPWERRFMRMELSPLEGGGIRLRHWLLRSEPQAPLVYLEMACQRGSDTHVRCSLCNRVKHREAWLEPGELMGCLGLAPAGPLRIIYGICPACARLAGESVAGEAA
jgi:LSD1 subclass zinc finger protein